MDKYIVLIADMEGSKQLEEKERKAAQGKLSDILTQLNKENSSVIAHYNITLGDEFQAVFKNADRLFADIWKIMAALYPVMLRFSVGMGGIATSIQKENVLSMDGPAFHAAREGIEDLKQGDSLFRIVVEDKDLSELRAINRSLDLLSKQVRSWRANRIVLQHLIRQGWDYKQISKEVGISERAFYKNKEAGSLDLVNALFDDIQDYINTRLKD